MLLKTQSITQYHCIKFHLWSLILMICSSGRSNWHTGFILWLSETRQYKCMRRWTHSMQPWAGRTPLIQKALGTVAIVCLHYLLIWDSWYFFLAPVMAFLCPPPLISQANKFLSPEQLAALVLTLPQRSWSCPVRQTAP